MKFALINLVGLVTLACTGGNAVADVIISFQELPNEGGVRLSGSDINGTPFNVTKLGAETFFLSSPVVPSGYPADATLSHIGISQSGDYYLANILESPGGPLSDQVYVHRLFGNFTVIDFISDPAQFVTGLTPTTTTVETGSLQNVLTYSNDRGETVRINVQSDLDVVPEPATLTVFGLGVVAVAGNALRRRKWGTNQPQG